MEQRALLAVALVAASVTAAGAGGYLAVRQMDAPPVPVAAERAAPAPPAETALMEGTEGEVLPPAEPVAAPTTVVRKPAVSLPRATEPRPVPTPRPVAAPARPIETAAPARPAVTTRRDDPAPVPRPSPTVRPEPEPAAPQTTTASRSDDWGTSDTWPSGDAGSPARDTGAGARDDGWPERESGTTTTDAPLPSRTAETTPSGPRPPVRRIESVTIPADSVIGVQLETTVSSATARVEDPVRARVTRDVLAGGSVVVPAGSRLLGNVTLVEEGGRIRERARLGVRFHTLVLSDGTEVRLPTETVYRDGESPSGRSAARIGGGAAGGAILGAILGGGKGAIIGAATGAGSGTAVAMAGGRKPAELRAGQPVTVRVSDPVSTTVER